MWTSNSDNSIDASIDSTMGRFNNSNNNISNNKRIRVVFESTSSTLGQDNNGKENELDVVGTFYSLLVFSKESNRQKYSTSSDANRPGSQELNA